MVSATGPNSLPSSPCRVSSGRNTMTMMTMPEVTGAATSRGGAVDQVQRRQAVLRLRRAGLSTFSTTTTAASTSMPMAMARPPRLIRLADRPYMPHQDEGGQRRQRQDQRDDQRRAQVAEERRAAAARPARWLRAAPWRRCRRRARPGRRGRRTASMRDALRQRRRDLGQPRLDAGAPRCCALAPRRPSTRPSTASPWPSAVTAP